jgi:signal transduction histidine kinase
MSKKPDNQQNIIPSQEKAQKRASLVNELGLSIHNDSRIFMEATQSCCHFLKMPICILDILVDEEFFIQSAFGLFEIGLINDLTRYKRMAKENCLSFQVLENEQFLMIENIDKNSNFTQHILVQEYGITSYLGVPLITLEGICLGTLAVMDIIPRSFTSQDLHFLKITARCCLMEYIYTKEKQSQLLNPQNKIKELNLNQNKYSNNSNFANNIKQELLKKFTQELKNPLTSIMGMASVLKQEVYGKITEKQKKYLEVIYDSGQYLISLLTEVIKLEDKNYNQSPKLAPFDVGMLCQQVLNNLEHIGHHYQQKLSLTIEPGKRIWLLDKDKLQASLFYLILAMIESGENGGEIKLHFSRKNDNLNFTLWSSHPWLDQTSTQPSIYTNVFNYFAKLSTYNNSLIESEEKKLPLNNYFINTSDLKQLLHNTEKNKGYGQLLELFLSCHWIEAHQGKMLINNFPNLGYRYTLILPQVESSPNREL